MNRLMIDFTPNGFNIPTLTELPLKQVQAMSTGFRGNGHPLDSLFNDSINKLVEDNMSIQTKIEIIKGLMIGVAKDATVKLLVPRAYWLFAEEFKGVDSRIKKVVRNNINGFSVIEIEGKDSKIDTVDIDKTKEVGNDSV